MSDLIHREAVFKAIYDWEEDWITDHLISVLKEKAYE